MSNIVHNTLASNSLIVSKATLRRTRAPNKTPALAQEWAVSPVNIQMDPPQMATEGFSSDSLSERSPEQHTKNVEKSRRANVIFFGKIQNGSYKRNFVYYSVILITKM